MLLVSSPPPSPFFCRQAAVRLGADNSRSSAAETKARCFKCNIKSQMKRDTRLCISFHLAPRVGLEPTTLRLTAECSTDWANEEYIKSWRLPIFPGSHPPSIFSIEELNCRVRDGYGCFLFIIITRILFTFCSSFIPYFWYKVNIFYLFFIIYYLFSNVPQKLYNDFRSRPRSISTSHLNTLLHLQL